MFNDQSGVSSLEQFVYMARTDTEFRAWLENYDRECEMFEAINNYQPEDRCIVEYLDTMRQRTIEDLQRLKVTDPEIVGAAKAGDLDKVATLLESLKADKEVAYMITTIEGWRAYLNKTRAKPSGETP